MKRLWVVLLLLTFSQPVFGYTFKDVCREMAPTENASKSILNVMNSLKRIQVDEDTQGIMDFVWEGMDRDSFYFGDIYSSTYFKPARNDYRAITLKHTRNADTNQIQISPQCYEDVNISLNNGAYIWIMEFGIKSNPIASQLRNYRSFSLRFRSKEAWPNAGDVQPAYIADGLFKVADPTNLKQLKMGPPCSLNEDYKGATALYVNNFCNTLPTLSAVINQYFEFNNFLEVKSVSTGECSQGQRQEKIEYTHIQFSPAIKHKALKKDFPEMEKGVDKWRKLITFQGILKNKRGNTYGKVTITPQKTLIEGYTYQGKLIPYDENGKLVFEEAGTLENEPELIAEGYVKFDFLGVKAVVEGTTSIEHIAKDENDYITIKLEKAKYNYTGRLLGFIPMSVVKFLSPIDIDEFLDDMMYTVLRANGGEGSKLSVGWEVDDQRNRLSNVSVSTEVLDHYMVQFMMRYARVFFGSDNQVAFDQSYEFFDKLLSSATNDMEVVYSDMDYSAPIQGLAQRE